MSPSIDTKLEEYRQNLNRYKGLSLEKIPQRYPQLSLPSVKYRTQTLTQFDVSLIDFLSIQDCDIGYLVGEKNSILGKVMSHSQRLVYETNIIRAIENCAVLSLVNSSESSSSDSSLGNKLREIASIKRIELPKAFGNALWAGEEAQRFFSFSNGYLPMATSQLGFQQLILSLGRLKDVGEQLQSLPDLNNSTLEGAFKVIYHSEYAGRLVLTHILLTDELNQVADGLNRLNPDDAFCSGPMLFLKQQFINHYIKGIQPYMAAINSSAYAILNDLMQLHSLSGILDSSMEQFLAQFSLSSHNSVWSLYQQASQVHAKAWNRLLRECGVF